MPPLEPSFQPPTAPQSPSAPIATLRALAAFIVLTNSARPTIDSHPNQSSRHCSAHDFFNSSLLQDWCRTRSPRRARLYRPVSFRSRHPRVGVLDPLHPLLRNRHGLPMAQHRARMAPLDRRCSRHGPDRCRGRRCRPLGHGSNPSTPTPPTSFRPDLTAPRGYSRDLVVAIHPMIL